MCDETKKKPTIPEPATPEALDQKIPNAWPEQTSYSRGYWMGYAEGFTAGYSEGRAEGILSALTWE